MQLNNLTISQGIIGSRRIGRGGKRGKTSGKGSKGQKSRAGHKIRPAERDMIKRIPKRRGFGKNRARTVNSGRVRPVTVNVGVLEQVFSVGDRVDPRTLKAHGLVGARGGKEGEVKVLGFGSLTKKLTIVGCTLSKSARAQVEKAGGTIL